MQTYIKRYGLYSAATILALLILIWTIWGFSVDYKTQEILGYLSMVISLTFIFFGIKAYRDNLNGGSITFGKALKLGSLIALLPSIAFCFYVIVFLYIFGAKWSEFALANMSEAQRAQFAKSPELFMNPFFQGIVMFFTVFMVGFIISLLSAFILRKDNKKVEVVV